jgi:hypothetical protein
MGNNWVKIFESKQPIQAEIVRETLDQNEIAAIIFDRQDSLYPVLGMYEVHVPFESQAKAQNILNNEGTLTEFK